MNQQVRLNKFIAERTGMSRREADMAISNGKIIVNSQSARLGMKIDKKDKIYYNNKIVPFQADFTYLMLNKPVGYVCSRHQQGNTPTIYELLPPKYQNLKTVGRLDKDSSGLILLTNDGDFAFRMTHPKFVKTKIYIVKLDHALTESDQIKIQQGVQLSDGISKLALRQKSKDNRTWQVTMHEGRNRQIRRTFAEVGYKVIKLHRLGFGRYKLRSLQQGHFKKSAFISYD